MRCYGDETSKQYLNLVGGVWGEKKRLRAVFLPPLKELFFFCCCCCVCTFSGECVGFIAATLGVRLLYTPSLLMLSLLAVKKRCSNSWILKISLDQLFYDSTVSTELWVGCGFCGC